MSRIDRKELRLLIEGQIELTKQKLEELKEFTQPIGPENAIGRVSRMDAINNKSINDAAKIKLEEKLKKLNLALSKVDVEDFGICINCNNPIQPRRLALMPESPKCVRCANR